jgi:hypothetical protein
MGNIWDKFDYQINEIVRREELRKIRLQNEPSEKQQRQKIANIKQKLKKISEIICASNSREYKRQMKKKQVYYRQQLEELKDLV